MCKNKENPELNNGTGFICFQSPQTCANVLRKFQKAQESPEERVLIDPENTFEIEGRPMHLKQALPKNEAKNLNKGPNNAALLVKLKKGKITFSELIQLDREAKRNLALAAKGLAVTEDNVETDNKGESEKRAAHLAEKMEKMKNPNFKVSPTRVLLKSVSKNLEEDALKELIKKVFVSKLTPKELKHKKLLKDIKVLRDDQKGGRPKVG